MISDCCQGIYRAKKTNVELLRFNFPNQGLMLLIFRWVVEQHAAAKNITTQTLRIATFTLHDNPSDSLLTSSNPSIGNEFGYHYVTNDNFLRIKTQRELICLAGLS